MDDFRRPEGGEAVGYRKPPSAARFQKGQSGNPKGRPRNRRREIPYDHILGQMVTIRESGRERRITAAEAFLLHLTKKGLEGDNASARASLAAIEQARSNRKEDSPRAFRIVYKCVSPGSVGCALDDLGMAVKLNRSSVEATYQLKPWLIQRALDQFGNRRLTCKEQAAVYAITRTPEAVCWPEWWEVRS